MTDIRWSRRSIDDLDKIAAYLGASDQDLAANIVDAIRQGTKRLKDFPRSGPAIGFQKLCKISLPHLRYIVIYRIDNGVVVVSRVHHSSKNWQAR